MTSPTISQLLEHQNFKSLNQEQVDSFMKHGFLRIPGAILPEKGEMWTKNVWNRLGMDPNDKSTWHSERTNMPQHGRIPCSEVAPAAWAAICELCGGEDRVSDGGRLWSDGFIVNLGKPEYEGKRWDPKDLDNWHVDGDFFMHFLDSPEQALLVIPCWSDVESNGGATWICDEGPARIGKHLFDNPEGVTPRMMPRGTNPDQAGDLQFYFDLIKQADDSSFHEMTGKKGDVILMHPLMLHSASKNGRRLARIITNPPVSLRTPFKFSREDPAEYSLVELKTMYSVGGEEGPAMFKDWKITRDREMVVPERVKRQQRMLAEENERLRKLGLPESDKSITQAPQVLGYGPGVEGGKMGAVGA